MRWCVAAVGLCGLRFRACSRARSDFIAATSLSSFARCLRARFRCVDALFLKTFPHVNWSYEEAWRAEFRSRHAHAVAATES